MSGSYPSSAIVCANSRIARPNRSYVRFSRTALISLAPLSLVTPWPRDRPAPRPGTAPPHHRTAQTVVRWKFMKERDGVGPRCPW
ncbi:hypothetical protein GCM10023324_11700 [Streptomyces youssoufiensis]